MTFVRWFLGLLLSLVLLIGLAVVFLPLWFNPNDYRDDIEAQIESATGRQVALDGDLSLSVFPWLGVKTQQVVVSQPAKIGGDFLRVDSAQIRLKLMPLLSKQVELDTIVVESPTINIVKVSDVLDSFTIETDSANSSASSPQTLKPASADEGDEEGGNEEKGTAPQITLNGVIVRNASLSYTDRAAGSSLSVSALNLDMGNIFGADLAPLTISGQLHLEDQAPITLQATADTRFDTQSQAIALQDLSIELEQLDESDQSKQTIELTTKQVSVSELNALTLIDSSIKLVSTSVGKPVNLTVPKLSVNLKQQTLNAAELTAEVAASRLIVRNLAIQQLLEEPTFSASIEMPEHSLNSTLQALAVDYQPTADTALSKVGLTAQLKGSSDNLQVSQALLKLDMTKVDIDGRVNNFDNPAFEFKVAVDQLKLDDYLPLSAEGETTSSKGSSDAKPLAEALVVPLAVFDGFPANGSLSFGQIESGGLTLKNVLVDVKSDAKGVTVTPSAKLYEGTLGGDISYLSNDGNPQLKIKNEIDLVSIGELFAAAQVSDQLSGLGSLVLDLVISEQNGVQSNSGTIKLFAKDGALKGVDVKGILDSTYAQYQSLRGKSQPANETSNSAESSIDSSSQTHEGKSDQADETKFAELLGTFTLKDFKLSNNDFSLNAPLFKITGAGDIDLAAETIDYRVSISVVDSADGQGSEALDKLKGITIPVRFSGNLLAPRYSLDTKALYRLLLKSEIDQKKGAYLQEKLGIEGAENLSTKETVKQALLESLLKSNKDNTQEKPMGSNDSTDSSNSNVTPLTEPTSSTQSLERPMQSSPSDSSAADAVDTTATASESASQSAEPSDSTEKKPMDKDALKKELGKKLLDELFK